MPHNPLLDEAVVIPHLWAPKLWLQPCLVSIVFMYDIGIRYLSIYIFKRMYKWRWAQHYWVPLRSISGFLGDSLIIQSASSNYEQATNSKGSIITYHMPANIHSSPSRLVMLCYWATNAYSHPPYQCKMTTRSSRHKAWMLTCFSVLKQRMPSRALQEKVSVCVHVHMCVSVHTH